MINGITTLLKFMNSTQSGDKESKNHTPQSPTESRKTYLARNKVLVSPDLFQKSFEHEIEKASEISQGKWGYITRFKLWIQTEEDPMKVYVYMRKNKTTPYYCVRCNAYSRTSVVKIIKESDGTTRCYEWADHGEGCFERFDKVVISAEVEKRKFALGIINDENVSPTRMTRKKTRSIQSNSKTSSPEGVDVVPVVIVIKPDNVTNVEPDDNSNDLPSPSTIDSSTVEAANRFSNSGTPTRRSLRTLRIRDSMESSSDISTVSERRILRARSCVAEMDTKIKCNSVDVKSEPEAPILTGYRTSIAELRALKIPLSVSNVLPKSMFILGFQDKGVKDGKIIQISKRDKNKCQVYTTYNGMMRLDVWKYSCTDCRRYNRIVCAYRILRSGVVLTSDKHFCHGRRLDEEIKKQAKYQCLAGESTKVVPNNLWILPCDEGRIKNVLFLVSEKDPKLGCRFTFQGKDNNGSLAFTCESCSKLNTVTCATVAFKDGKITVTTEVDEEHESHCFTVNLKEALSKEGRVLINPGN